MRDFDRISFQLGMINCFAEMVDLESTGGEEDPFMLVGKG